MNNVVTLYLIGMFVGIPLFLLTIYLLIKAVKSRKGMAILLAISKYKITWVIILLSLLTPAYVQDYYGKSQYVFGFMAFLLGPIGFFAGHFSWIANIFLFLGFIKRKTNIDSSNLFFVVAIISGLTFLLPEKIASGSAGEYEYHAHIGFYLWLFSMVCALIENVRIRQIKKYSP